METTSAALEAERGKALRGDVKRTAHGVWSPEPGREDPLALLDEAAAERLQYLVPIRNARMFDSAFAFFRGSAIIMAADLAPTPATGLRVQASGDAHCLNFGGFATPERNLIFDLNDFDETLPGPWEWDLKRLVTSFVIAARHNGHPTRHVGAAALSAAFAYRERMRQLARLPALEVWYGRLDATKILEAAKRAERRPPRGHMVAAAKIAERVENDWRFRDDPPILFHSDETERSGFDIEEILREYQRSLSHDVALLFQRYRLVDIAIKIVGVGSVGTRCGIALYVADDHDVLLLQIKEATRSVLERHFEPSVFASHGERVVRGQRLMQAASDLFLGWASSGEHDFYVRQFKDMKASAELDGIDTYALREYGSYCGRALAAAHARSGSAAAIAGYLGRSDTFDRALVAFATDYADQSLRDYECFVAAVDDGRIEIAEDAA
ncbi:MAG: DUF2252 domain-containing protein [Candidatus Eremiobacteraeota bacterium]|nr:DUF2252 domain-containing protein [Candidatus Eremiobacteraeota bacterium]